MNTLACAECWGVPPWVIWHQPGAPTWIARKAVYDEAVTWKRHWDAKK